MKRIGYSFAACSIALALAASVGFAATPNPNSAVIVSRVFDDCPFSTFAVIDNYAAQVQLSDFTAANTCFGFANLHTWSFSEDNTAAAVFDNNSCFSFSGDLVISGTGQAEAGPRISPWWSKNVDGRINIRTTDGEIAAFGGRLPFYSFTANHGITYVKGNPIHFEMHYDPNGLSMADPATIQYVIGYGGNTYMSPVLSFDEGNAGEGMGTWGILNDARAGGVLQVLWGPSPPTADRNVVADFTNIDFRGCTPTATKSASWGTVKSIYR